MPNRKAAQTRIYSKPALRGRNSKCSVGVVASLSALLAASVLYYFCAILGGLNEKDAFLKSAAQTTFAIGNAENGSPAEALTVAETGSALQISPT